jgi:hypothetical protein
MRDIEHAHPARPAQSGKEIDDAAPGHGILAGRRFIEDQEIRLAAER